MTWCYSISLNLNHSYFYWNKYDDFFLNSAFWHTISLFLQFNWSTIDTAAGRRGEGRRGGAAISRLFQPVKLRVGLVWRQLRACSSFHQLSQMRTAQTSSSESIALRPAAQAPSSTSLLKTKDTIKKRMEATRKKWGIFLTRSPDSRRSFLRAQKESTKWLAETR